MINTEVDTPHQASAWLWPGWQFGKAQVKLQVTASQAVECVMSSWLTRARLVTCPEPQALTASLSAWQQARHPRTPEDSPQAVYGAHRWLLDARASVAHASTYTARAYV